VALISICNRQDSQRLQVLADQINTLKESVELPDYDFKVLEDITHRAASGNWEAASRAIRRLMEDQIQSN
jgi:hypothetical protein